MRLRFFGFGVTLLFSLATARAETLTPAAHPTQLVAEYHGQRYPVVAVEKEDAVILLDGKSKRLRGNVPLSTERLQRFRGLRAEMSAVKVDVLQLVTANSEIDVQQAASSKGATIGGYVDFEATITAEQDLSQCFVALFAYDKDFIDQTSERPNAQIRIRQIDDLRAGKPSRIKFSSTPLLSNGKMRVFALLFSGPDEVITNVGPEVARYFQRRERVIHATAVRQWLKENPTGNRSAQPVLQVPPQFESTEGFPSGTSAILFVGTDGTVTDLRLNGDFSPVAQQQLSRALSSWLFLPRIKNGVADVCEVTIPLRF